MFQAFVMRKLDSHYTLHFVRYISFYSLLTDSIPRVLLSRGGKNAFHTILLFVTTIFAHGKNLKCIFGFSYLCILLKNSDRQ